MMKGCSPQQAQMPVRAFTEGYTACNHPGVQWSWVLENLGVFSLLVWQKRAISATALFLDCLVCWQPLHCDRRAKHPQPTNNKLCYTHLNRRLRHNYCTKLTPKHCCCRAPEKNQTRPSACLQQTHKKTNSNHRQKPHN